MIKASDLSFDRIIAVSKRLSEIVPKESSCWESDANKPLSVMATTVNNRS
jgi:hypothetical protein